MVTSNDPDATRVELTGSEIELMRAALRTLLSTLGKEEADEIDEIQALLEKLGLSPNA